MNRHTKQRNSSQGVPVCNMLKRIKKIRDNKAGLNLPYK